MNIMDYKAVINEQISILQKTQEDIQKKLGYVGHIEESCMIAETIAKLCNMIPISKA